MTRIILAFLLAGRFSQFGFAGQEAAPGKSNWITTWGCGPQLVEPGNLPPAPLADSTLRQFVRVSIGGNHMRVRFCNAFGTNSVTINSAHIALTSGGGSRSNAEIDVATDKALTFHDKSSVEIPAGETIYSDPVNFNVPSLANLAVTIYFGDISATTITGHPGSRTTSFVEAGDVVTAASMPSAKGTAHWYLITGVEVVADDSCKTAVVLGDSITDGRGSTTDGNNRWPDDLAQRLLENSATTNVAVVNMGIGGNGIFGGLGPAATKRFERDVLEQNGARWFILFEGVNDIGWKRSDMATATNLVSVYTDFAKKAHANGLRAYGATITPFGKSFYDSALHEEERQFVNAWLRTNKVYDAVIDFDAAVRNPAAPTELLPAYDSGDHLHLNPAGYHAMANAIDLNLFAR